MNMRSTKAPAATPYTHIFSFPSVEEEARQLPGSHSAARLTVTAQNQTVYSEFLSRGRGASRALRSSSPSQHAADEKGAKSADVHAGRTSSFGCCTFFFFFECFLSLRLET